MTTFSRTVRIARQLIRHPPVVAASNRPIIPKTMSLLLIGYRGCGKTTIGRRMADRLWWQFLDTDELVTKAAGRTIKELFEQSGEQEFRDLEVGAVREACVKEEHTVALGGGA